jgi:hypothetical protein
MIEIAEPRSGVVSGKLTCGWVDDQGVLHQSFVVKEMTGVEEDLLAGKGPVLPRLNKVIVNCIESIGSISDRHQIARAVDLFTASDRMILLVAIRRASLGDSYLTKIKCPSCSADSDISLNLSTLETREMSSPQQRNYETLISTGEAVRWHIMTGIDEDWLQNNRKRLKSDNDILTLAMLARVDAVGDQVINRMAGFQNAIDCMKKMRSRDRNQLRNAFTETEGFIDTSVEYECPSCGNEFKGDLDIAQASFFFPQDTQKR